MLYCCSLMLLFPCPASRLATSSAGRVQCNRESHCSLSTGGCRGIRQGAGLSRFTVGYARLRRSLSRLPGFMSADADGGGGLGKPDSTCVDDLPPEDLHLWFRYPFTSAVYTPPNKNKFYRPHKADHSRYTRVKRLAEVFLIDNIRAQPCWAQRLYYSPH